VLAVNPAWLLTKDLSPRVRRACKHDCNHNCQLGVAWRQILRRSAGFLLQHSLDFASLMLQQKACLTPLDGKGFNFTFLDNFFYLAIL
jgi:hypothetical protein